MKRTTICVLLGGLLLVGCGDRADDLPVLRIADQAGGLQSLINASGVMKGAPYTIEWSRFPDSARVGEALRAQAADTGSMSEASFISARAAGSPVKAVQGLDTAGRGDAIALIVPAGSSVRSFADLRGKTIATTRNTSAHDLIEGLIAAQRWPKGAVEVLFLTPSDAKAAFSSGAVDAWATWDPLVATAQLRDKARVIADSRSPTKGLDGFQVATEKAIVEKRAVLTDFLTRLVRAEAWGLANQASYAERWGKEVGLPADIATLTTKRLSRLPVRLDEAAIARTQPAIARRLKDGSIAKAIDLRAAFDQSFNQIVPAPAP